MDLNLLKQAAGTVGGSNLSPALNRTLLPEEKKILDLKYSGKTFGQMTLAELKTTAKEVLLRIHIITGWIMPPDEMMLVLVDEFNKKVLESYPNVTAEEISFAFRSGGHEVKEWGKSLNISLIDEVMIPYLEKRISISQIEEQKKLPKAEVTQAEKDQIDREYEAFKNSPLGKRLIPKENL